MWGPGMYYAMKKADREKAEKKIADALRFGNAELAQQISDEHERKVATGNRIEVIGLLIGNVVLWGLFLLKYLSNK